MDILIVSEYNDCFVNLHNISSIGIEKSDTPNRFGIFVKSQSIGVTRIRLSREYDEYALAQDAFNELMKQISEYSNVSNSTPIGIIRIKSHQ